VASPEEGDAEGAAVGPGPALIGGAAIGTAGSAGAEGAADGAHPTRIALPTREAHRIWRTVLDDGRAVVSVTEAELLLAK